MYEILEENILDLKVVAGGINIDFRLMGRSLGGTSALPTQRRIGDRGRLRKWSVSLPQLKHKVMRRIGWTTVRILHDKLLIVLTRKTEEES